MTLALDAISRTETGKQVSKGRSAGRIPAVVYGNVKENAHVYVDEKQFKKIFAEAGESTLVDVAIDKKSPCKVLIQEVQRDPISHAILHADLFAINMKEKITAEVELKFVGESKAVKELAGTLVKNQDTVEIECLPGDLVHSIEVDISTLATFDDRITVKDLPKPAGVEFTDKPENVVVFVSEPRSEEEMKELDSAIDEGVKDVEVEERGKKEEEGETKEEGESQDKKKEESKKE